MNVHTLSLRSLVWVTLAILVIVGVFVCGFSLFWIYLQIIASFPIVWNWKLIACLSAGIPALIITIVGLAIDHEAESNSETNEG